MTQRKISSITAFIFSFLFVHLLGAQGWERLYPNSTQTLSSRDVLINTEGNYLGLGGTFFVSQVGIAQIVKADQQGNALWNIEHAPMPGSMFSMNAIVNAENGGYAMVGEYYFSGTDNGIMVYRLDSQGNLLWSKDFACCDDRALDIISTADGGFLIVGYKAIPPDHAVKYAWAIRLDANGSVVWDKAYFEMTQFVQVYNDGFRRVVKRQNGNYLMVGSGDGEIRVVEMDDNGDVVSQQFMDNPNGDHLICSDLEETQDGGLLVGGARLSAFSSNFDGGMLWKYDASGSLSWTKLEPGLNENVNSLTENGQGEYFVAYRNFIQKLASDGSTICSLNEAGERNWSGIEVEATNDGGAIAALTNRPNMFLPEIYLSLVKLDANCQAAVDVVRGNVNVDTDGDCIDNGPGAPLNNWLVELNDGQVSFFKLTDSNGDYFFNVNAGTYDLTLHPPMSYWESCDQNLSVSVGPSPDTVVQDLQAIVLDNCPYLVVDLASPPMRPCFERVASVSYANLGPATAANSYILITLDTLLLMDTASIPYTALPGNVYQFDLGDVEQGDVGYIWFQVQADCDLELGNTVCLQANIFPDTLCGAENWAGATIQVQGDCDGDTINFEIKNVGPADMATPLGFIVVEDDVMYMQGNFDLNTGQSQIVSVPNEHGIYTAIADQESGYPFGSFAMDLVAFCQNPNLNTQFSTAYFNLFPYDDGAPTVDLECVQVTNSYDPNQLLANPEGWGASHLIEQNTPIEYHVDFQNTGTDTAYNIVIRDTLSQHFDLANLRPGASSHPYQVQLEGPGVLVFTFPNINLLDSTSNEPASHGFVEFKIWQQPDLPIGTVIENQVAIYFDFNEPIFTNTTFHTVGESFIEIINDVSDVPQGLGELLAYPNPAFDAVTFSLPFVLGENASFQLHDQLGKLAHNQSVSGSQFRFEKKDMASGIYFYTISNEKGKLYSGKVILR